MTEAVEAASYSTAAMAISTSKEAGSKRTLVDELCLTARSPMGWVLLLALLLTWSCVAIVLFDLLDYKTLGEYTSYCDDPCLPPGVAPPPPAVRKVMRAAGRSRGAAQQVISDPLNVASLDHSQEPTDWLNVLLTFASSLVEPEDEEMEVIQTEEL